MKVSEKQPSELPRENSKRAYNELRALASVMKREPMDVAAQLLEAVIYDAKSQISEALLAEVEQTRRDIVIADLAGNVLRVEFGREAPKI